MLAGVTVPGATLELKSVTRRFGPVTAVDRIDLAIQQNEFFALLGPSGSGKTTLLRIIAGLERPDEGQVEIAGRDVTDLPPYGRHVGMVFQNFLLFPAQDRGGEHRLSAADAEPAEGEARRAARLGHGPAAAAGAGGALSQRVVRWAAAARRTGARA
jgi:ABC-type nitrate/sulfonate/bicarbonate transport system ATPase subunit